jgi:hypothetical protein
VVCWESEDLKLVEDADGDLPEQQGEDAVEDQFLDRMADVEDADPPVCNKASLPSNSTNRLAMPDLAVCHPADLRGLNSPRMANRVDFHLEVSHPLHPMISSHPRLSHRRHPKSKRI